MYEKFHNTYVKKTYKFFCKMNMLLLLAQEEKHYRMSKTDWWVWYLEKESGIWAKKIIGITKGTERVWMIGLRILSLLFGDDVV